MAGAWWVAFVLIVPGCVFDPSGYPAAPVDGEVPSDVGPAVCGDGVRQAGEQCDGDDLGGQTCVSQGYAGGALGCTVGCVFDRSQCEIGGDCGNGVIDGAEQCDTTELDGRTCTSETGHADGVLTCTGQCTVDTSLCHTCGDNFMEGGEACDGVITGQDCTDHGFTGGQLACVDCQVALTGCFTCGDGVCDGALGETSALCPADCGWVAVTAGDEHTCAVSGGGTLWCWGLNGDGQLGLGDTDNRELPTQVPGLTGVVAASAGAAHTCAVLANGAAWCWGLNGDGQLGIGSTVFANSPQQVVGLTGVTAVSAGGAHTCALTGQTPWCWGLNDKGQVGNDTSNVHEVPVPVIPTAAFSLAEVITTGTKHSCAVHVDGTAWCWGEKGSGRIGDGANADQPAPVPVSTDTGLTTVTTLDAGDHHTCAVEVTGAAWCWGEHAHGRLGDGGNSNQPEPVLVSTTTGLTQAEQISAGLHHTCAVDVGGAAWCWGENSDGRLGDGSTTERTVPSPVSMSTGLTSALMITTGALHSCALKSDYTVWCWGGNGVGQLGDGTSNPRDEPVPIL